LRAAAQSSLSYFDAHYNLGNALASEGDLGGAAEQFTEAVRLRPDDADAHANLGSALAELGHFAEAKAQFERARN
jgi:Flp pilus assembly protein TadD